MRPYAALVAGLEDVGQGVGHRSVSFPSSSRENSTPGESGTEASRVVPGPDGGTSRPPRRAGRLRSQRQREPMPQEGGLSTGMAPH